LSATNAGNGTNTQVLGQGGNRWSFCPHTVHNSYILDIGLSEEIERAVAGPDVEARKRAFDKLRNRVREQAEEEAPNWNLSQSQTVQETVISVLQRKRPRGDFKNLKMTGMVGEDPKDWIRGIMGFEKRKQWESMFEDGVVVQGIDLGETYSLLDDNYDDEDDGLESGSNSATPNSSKQEPPSAALETAKTVQSEGADDVLAFLQTVELAGIPAGMSIAYLNDPERQQALAHLRKQMMLSSPNECMLCQYDFDSPADIRFCPCCAMVSCVNCVCKRVFEAASRQVVSICLHCYRESSRIRHPPESVKNSSGLDSSVRGKWWRPEELNLVDYTNSNSSNVPMDGGAFGGMRGIDMSTSMSMSHMDANSALLAASNDPSNELPLLNGLAEGDETKDDTHVKTTERKAGKKGKSKSRDTSSVFDLSDLSEADILDAACGGQGIDRHNEDDDEDDEDDEDDDEDDEDDDDAASIAAKKKVIEIGDGVGREVDESDTELPPVPTESAAQLIAKQVTKETYARCKTCGATTGRDVESIEAHMDACNPESNAFSGTPVSPLTANSNSLLPAKHAQLNIKGRDLNKCATRIIYRTARSPSGGVFNFRPREVCALQDSFVDSDGSCYVYEISIRHCDVQGTPGYVTADVLMQMYVARPVKGSKGASSITIVSQIDTRAKGPGQWFLSLVGEDGSDTIGVPRREDLVRELKASGNLQNILKSRTDGEEDEDSDSSKVNLDDFELLAVLGRGGFGKVMQVRHKVDGEVYAMKILKKNELVKRRQVERTQTERTILAAVKHPFIVCLHYAFQNQSKLYMVMDFVQGGDFFTLMRKHRRLPEEWVRIYIGEIAMALQHLHDMDVVYRDLKPENILLCGDGHLKLTDFGLSRFFETRPPAPEDMIGEDDIVTRSFCGTEQYMSPEMLLQQGHNFRMDWWCVGLLMHEMISAKHPFHGPSHYDTLRNMVTKQPVIDNRLSIHAATVVRSLLIKNPRARLCCRGGMEELKSLPYFANLDWDALYEKRVNMAFRPDLKGETDVSSFETTFTREEPIDSTTSDPLASKDDKKRGGILGLFGYGNDTEKASEDQDSFRDFGFVKEESAISGAANVSSASVTEGDDSTGNTDVSNSDFVPAAPIRKEI